MIHTDTMGEITLLLRRLLYRSFSIFDSVSGWFGMRRSRAIVLCYHSVASDDWRFSVSMENFKKQIEWLIRREFQFLTLRGIAAIVSGDLTLQTPAVAITFDDGYKDVLTVKDCLCERGIFPTAFVLSDSDRAALSEVAPGKEFLSSDDIRTLRAAGWKIGCHSATHADFSTLSEDVIRYEVADAKARLESVAGEPVSYFAYPKGYYSPMIIENVRSAGAVEAHVQAGEVTAI